VAAWTRPPASWEEGEGGLRRGRRGREGGEGGPAQTYRFEALPPWPLGPAPLRLRLRLRLLLGAIAGGGRGPLLSTGACVRRDRSEEVAMRGGVAPASA